MPGEATAGTGLGKATGRAGERSEVPEAVVDAGGGEDVREELAAPISSLGDAVPLLSLVRVGVWPLNLHVGFATGKTD